MNPDGTILTTHKYAWSDRVGYLNFEQVTVGDSILAGYAWSANDGWINFNPVAGGVLNDGAGNLSGAAWGEQLGWIDFDGVEILESGRFSGTAEGELVGIITFDCPVYCDVETDWRPAMVSPGAASESGSVSSGGHVAPAISVVAISDVAATPSPKLEVVPRLPETGSLMPVLASASSEQPQSQLAQSAAVDFGVPPMAQATLSPASSFPLDSGVMFGVGAIMFLLVYLLVRGLLKGFMKRQKTILIVEDERSLREAMADVLRAENFIILEAKNGKEGVTLALSTQPDLILLDLIMPEMDGTTALKKLREDAWGQNVPIIILTNVSGANEQLVDDMIANKPLNYLIKSDWKAHDVADKIKQILEK